MKYECPVCGYVYDEAAEGRAWADLPPDWECPICGAPKSVFKPVGEQKEVEVAPSVAPLQTEERELTPAELAAICSNLARGCEKQYKEEERALFSELAAHYTSLVPPAEGDWSSLASAVKKCADEQFAAAKAQAVASGDRGAQRALVWGEKVNAILSSLLDRYGREGEEMFRGKKIWLCTICGFIYIGENPPEICPVCKVPSFKFEEVSCK